MHDRRSEKLGLVAQLMYQSRVYQSYPLACLRYWIEPAIELQQIQFLFDHEGTPLAYWTWAFLAPDVEYRLIHDPKVLLHESEWNEGNKLWIMDLVASRGYLRSVISYMKSSIFLNYEKAHSLRRDRDGVVRKVSTWSNRTFPSGEKKENQNLILKMPPEMFASSQTEFFESKRSTKTPV